MPRNLEHNLLTGVGFGLLVATCFSAWVTVVRLVSGTEPFDRLHTTYGAVIELYYAGGFSGGVFIGLLWSLRRWPLGSMLLGIIGVFPLYYGAALLSLPRPDWFTSDTLRMALLLACLVGSPVGLIYWLRDNPRGPAWIDMLRYPTPGTAVKVAFAGLLVASLSWFGLAKWTGNWPFDLVILTTVVLFILPVGLAVLVTVRVLGLRGR